MSSRAVYIPPGKRKNKQQRFHGAFTGGFSAGYFNTVDTKEGWKPSNDTTKQQKLEDFMDEQDHEEWGGPTNVRKEYDTTVGESSEAVKKLEQQHPQHQYVPLGSLFTISHQTVGPRLLRKLGWREEGGKAFVPSNDDNNVHQGETDDKDVSSDIILSKKRLKKIKLQTARVKIPAPKLDPCGLGFEPHKDAPEFRQYRERRKQMARERGIGRPDRYMTSTLTAESERGATRVDKQQNNANQVDDYLAYETAEDFVGKRSVGGFALRDDDDDAYDNDDHRPTRMKLGEEYNAEIYEHQDSDDDGDVMGGGLVETKEGVLKQKDGDLGDILASWATKTTQDKSSSSIALTSDGRPPLEGFLLGGSMQSHKMRYPGPDIPRDYHITRHKFGENEHPLIFQTIARAVQLQERDRQRQEYNKRQNQQLTMLQQKSFSNLASAMKSRFTTSKDEEPKGPERVGLYQPEVLVQKEVEEQAESHTAETPKPITLKRTVQTFLPHPLVCKRFGVPVPKNAVGFDQHNPTSFTKPPSRQTEANYFEKEILTARNNDSSLTTEKAKASGQSTNEHVQDQEEDDGMTGIQRPSIEKLKAIFEPESESESDTDLDASSGDEKSIVPYSNSTAKEGSSQMIVYEEKDDGEQSDSSSSTKSSTRHHRKEHHRKKHHRSKSKRRRKRDRSPDSDDDRRRRKERRKKHERKRRKKSSRRKAEKDKKN